MHRRLSRLRAIELARAGWGAALLIAPGQVMDRVHRVDVDRRSLVVARILGARQLTQALLSGINPSPEILALGVWVDTAHAGTAIGLAIADPRRARAGLTDALIALAWAGFGYRDLLAGTAPGPRHDRRRDTAARRALQLLPGGRFLAASSSAPAALPSLIRH